MAISAKLVKELREKTGAGMMDCKKALVETNGNLEEAGFAVEHARDGLECCDMLEKAPDDYYNLVLMDIQMPNMNGYEAARKIRSMDNIKKSSVPVIAVTANAFEEDRKNAFDAGMNGHISKPIKAELLLSELRKALKKDISL